MAQNKKSFVEFWLLTLMLPAMDKILLGMASHLSPANKQFWSPPWVSDESNSQKLSQIHKKQELEI